jgi:hypothetical protein
MEVIGQYQTSAAMHPGNDPVPIAYEAEWARKPVAMFWRREKFIFPTGVRNLDGPARSLVIILTELSWRGVIS